MRDDYYIKLGNSIREIRQARALTQADLGRRLGVRGQTISQWESGSRRPTPQDLDRIAAVLRCTSDVFYHGPSRRDAPGGRERSIKALDALSEHERETLWQIFTVWDGNVHALLELVALYIDMSIADRGDVVAHMLTLAEDQKIQTRADLEYLNTQFRALHRRAK